MQNRQRTLVRTPSRATVNSKHYSLDCWNQLAIGPLALLQSILSFYFPQGFAGAIDR